MLLIKSILLLCSVATALAQTEYDALVSTAVFVGKDTTVSSAAAVEIFNQPKNHPAALASILYKLADDSRLRPYHKDVLTDSSAYHQFLDKVESFPGFKESRHVYTRFDLEDVDLYSFGYRVSGKYIPNIMPANRAALNFQRLIPQQLESPAPRNWLLNQIIVRSDGHGEEIQFEVAYIQMMLTREATGATKIDTQSLRLEQVVYTVDSNWLIKNAEELSQDYYEIVQIDKFVELLSTNQRHLRSGGNDDTKGGKSTSDLEAWIRDINDTEITRTAAVVEEIKTSTQRRLYPISQLRMGA
ncbi:hypothetical protein BGZ99_006258 [Dissophora globulifera]|uniref:Uncharacterized protein n=1 Tax=Dissophora globulifera TaxID=979702 RepID=A0A9P6UYP4_9FUNG|nr:hypothetical protein BGZ99_006258 [Dissophora globulifera]